MDRIWWIAIASSAFADLFFYHCATSVLRGRWWHWLPGSGFVGCSMLLAREWSERFCR